MPSVLVAGALDAVERYRAAIATGDLSPLAELVDDGWHSRVLGPRNATVWACGVDTLRQPHPLVAGEAEWAAPTSVLVQLCRSDLAIVRVDLPAMRSVTVYTLFNTQAGWRIAGEVTVSLAAGERAERYDANTAERAVLELLGRYYRAVDAGDGDALATVFDDCWQMKNLEHGRVVCEDKRTFMARVSAAPWPDYSRDRQVTCVEVVFDRFALVRIDKPSSEGVTMFLFLRTEAGWSIVDKAWAAPS